eukprot:TRINITY_DN10455_c0_g1_i2.p1 TRINITY_DN10455_c0_g1~~TRINITY_DN10455_c0_g1_i2.p1  ORF type:complete len:602 (-),score=193.92 TRINITY_DN10455_c0_g1_i2:107-1912(-)
MAELVGQVLGGIVKAVHALADMRSNKEKARTLKDALQLLMPGLKRTLADQKLLSSIPEEATQGMKDLVILLEDVSVRVDEMNDQWKLTQYLKASDNRKRLGDWIERTQVLVNSLSLVFLGDVARDVKAIAANSRAADLTDIQNEKSVASLSEFVKQQVAEQMDALCQSSKESSDGMAQAQERMIQMISDGLAKVESASAVSARDEAEVTRDVLQAVEAQIGANAPQLRAICEPLVEQVSSVIATQEQIKQHSEMLASQLNQTQQDAEATSSLKKDLAEQVHKLQRRDSIMARMSTTQDAMLDKLEKLLVDGERPAGNQLRTALQDVGDCVSRRPSVPSAALQAPQAMLSWVGPLELQAGHEAALLGFLCGDEIGMSRPEEFGDLETEDIEEAKARLPRAKRRSFDRAVEEMRAASTAALAQPRIPTPPAVVKSAEPVSLSEEVGLGAEILKTEYRNRSEASSTAPEPAAHVAESRNRSESSSTAPAPAVSAVAVAPLMIDGGVTQRRKRGSAGQSDDESSLKAAAAEARGSPLSRPPIDLFEAARQGSIAAVEEALGLPSVVVDQRDKDGKTPLWMAVAWGQPAVAALLLKANADLSLIHI